MSTLVKKAQRGDAEAFISLIEENRMTLRRVALGYLGNDEDAADAIQDAILDAFQHIGTLRKEEYFKSWLVRILINRCTKIYRKNKEHVSLEEAGEIEASDKRSAEVEFLQLLSSLPEESRAIFQLYYGEEFSTREIADILKINENTVKSRLHRGREQLRMEL